MTPIEAMANAMAEATGASRQITYQEMAVAALNAIREPSSAMIEAGLAAVSDVTVSEPKATAWDALRFFRAAIVAAITEQEQTS